MNVVLALERIEDLGRKSWWNYVNTLIKSLKMIKGGERAKRRARAGRKGGLMKRRQIGKDRAQQEFSLGTQFRPYILSYIGRIELF